jgi:hypothetical protein
MVGGHCGGAGGIWYAAGCEIAVLAKKLIQSGLGASKGKKWWNLCCAQGKKFFSEYQMLWTGGY